MGEPGSIPLSTSETAVETNVTCGTSVGSVAAKAVQFLRRGREIPDRIRNKAGTFFDRGTPTCQIADPRPPEDVFDAVADLLEQRRHAATLHPDDGFEMALRHAIDRLDGCRAPFGLPHNGTATLGRLCYAVCRAMNASRVVETGVAYGVTSSYILQALADNDHGELISIDLPPLADKSEDFVGALVPAPLKRRWNLQIGSAQKVLPRALHRMGPIDVFVHDSLHTLAHMNWEFGNAMRALRDGGVLIADDIQGNQAFDRVLQHPRAGSWFAVRQEGKNALCGVVRLK